VAPSECRHKGAQPGRWAQVLGNCSSTRRGTLFRFRAARPLFDDRAPRVKYGVAYTCNFCIMLYHIFFVSSGIPGRRTDAHEERLSVRLAAKLYKIQQPSTEVSPPGAEEATAIGILKSSAPGYVYRYISHSPIWTAHCAI